MLFEDIGSVETNKWVFISDQRKVKKLYSWIVVYVVKIIKIFLLVGMPCKHAVAAIQFKNFKVVDYVNKYYSREIYGVCYGHKVVSINGMDIWPDDIQPLKYKKGLSRPKKLRRREPDEDPNRTRLTRDPVAYKGTRCRAIGHNSRRCPLPPPTVLEEENVELNGAQDANQGAGEGATQDANQGAGEDANQAAGEDLPTNRHTTIMNVLILNYMHYLFVDHNYHYIGICSLIFILPH